MKPMLLVLVVTFALLVLSVQSRAQTSYEEYNYVTKGYKVQIESGLDMKKGYRFEDLTSYRLSYTTGGFKETEFKALFKEGAKKPAAILCMLTRSGNSTKEYICIPQPNSPRELWDSTFARISALEGESATALMWGLAKLSAFYSMK